MGRSEYRKKEKIYKINNIAMASVAGLTVILLLVYYLRNSQLIIENFVQLVTMICVIKLMLIGLKNNIRYHIGDKLKEVESILGKVRYKGSPQNIGYYSVKLLIINITVLAVLSIVLFIAGIYEGYKYGIIEIILTIILCVVTIIDFIIRKYKFIDYRNTIYENGLISSNGNIFLFKDAESMVIEDTIMGGPNLKILGDEYFSKNQVISTVFINNKDFDEVQEMFEGMCKYDLDE